ncbi:hypothetical protein RA27_01430 [Ruegeria sp. ANG-R]|uniref:DUF4262 domain-containing protein n=1 Tax=Ruegeria sp. ANG-R TaxID=1577903 RepID=UPI0005807C88|nr:DUF4262 domain-containing protein [Ruegeria sp. ANG-R]KIC42095.1 hypothetical protein RA27_01430 [Ruegeria sp. ANG-R]
MPDLPEVSDFTKNTIALVDEFGWAFTSVFPTADDPEETPEFSYSTNLDEFCGLPELIVFGLPKDTAHRIVSDIVDRAKSGWVWEGGNAKLDEIIENYPVELRPVHPSNLDNHFGASVAFREATKRPKLGNALQVFWPDRDGAMPWEAENAPWYQPQLDRPDNESAAKGLGS